MAGLLTDLLALGLVGRLVPEARDENEAKRLQLLLLIERLAGPEIIAHVGRIIRCTSMLETIILGVELSITGHSITR